MTNKKRSFGRSSLKVLFHRNLMAYCNIYTPFCTTEISYAALITQEYHILIGTGIIRLDFLSDHLLGPRG